MCGHLSTRVISHTPLFLSLFLLAANLPGNEVPPPHPFPGQVTNIDGIKIDVRKLARKKQVVVVTLKATWCPVCQKQLLRLKENIGRIDLDRITFMVLSPGPKTLLKKVRDRTAFPYPFIEDEGLTIAGMLNLRLNENEIIPSVFILDRKLRLRWIRRGRNSRNFGEDALLEELGVVEWI